MLNEMIKENVRYNYYIITKRNDILLLQIFQYLRKVNLFLWQYHLPFVVVVILYTLSYVAYFNRPTKQLFVCHTTLSHVPTKMHVVREYKIYNVVKIVLRS